MSETEGCNDPSAELMRELDQLIKKPQYTAMVKGIVANFTNQTREASLKLCERGWYLDTDILMPVIRRSAGIDFSAPVESIEESLVRYYTKNLDEISRFIEVRLENRYHLISPAFGAHKRGEYALSIPALFAQADGVCKEALGYPLFQKNKATGKPQTHQYVDTIPYLLYKAIYLPLSDDFPISYSEKKRAQKGYTGLNRHTVLHGESLDFATEENSLKAISLINFLANVLPPFLYQEGVTLSRK